MPDVEFNSTDKRLCVCGHPASNHGADPGTRHACREQRAWLERGFPDEPGGVKHRVWHCRCVEFRAAELRSESEEEVLAALARRAPRTGSDDDEWVSADQLRSQLPRRSTQGVGVILGRLAKRGVIDMRRTYMGYYRTRA